MTIILEGFNPKRLVSANVRIHYHTRADVTAYWRKLAAAAVREQYGTADEGCAWYERARLVITFRYPDRKRRDVGNLYSYVAKALVDGCVDAGLLPDDSDRYLVGPDLRRDPEKGPHRIVIDVEDLDRCSLCGDPLDDPAGCPDLHGWEDHGTCCVGKCHVCKGMIA